MTSITIITVSYCSARTISDTCISVARQTHPQVQHIIVDGASTDETVNIARSYARAGATIISEPDSGIYDAMNKGLRLATGDVIGFLNADDMFTGPDILSQVAEVFEDQGIGACFSDLVYVDQDDVSRIRRVWRTRGCKPSALSIGWIPPHPTFYARRGIFAQVGGFDCRLRLAADHELICRILARKLVRAKYVPGVWVRMRLGGASNKDLKNIFTQNMEIISTLFRHNVGVSPLWPFFKLFDRIRQRSSARLIEARLSK